MTIDSTPPPDAWCGRCGTAEHLVEHTVGVSLGAPDIAPGVPDPDGFTEHTEWRCSRCDPEGLLA